jgi:predicted nucleic acid-binding protein
MPKPKVYVETTILSYLTALPSRDLVLAAHQQLTAEWWQSRDRFALFVSEAVLAEARRGDPSAAARRLQAAEGMEILSVTPEAQSIASALLASAALPRKATIDAIHVAMAAVHGMDFLLTWNCTHIANAIMRPRIEEVCEFNGLRAPVICTPEELVEQEKL